jgi:hypothetical protein
LRAIVNAALVVSSAAPLSTDSASFLLPVLEARSVVATYDSNAARASLSVSWRHTALELTFDKLAVAAVALPAGLDEQAARAAMLSVAAAASARPDAIRLVAIGVRNPCLTVGEDSASA